MGYSDGAIRLARPSVVELPRLDDRISFLFVDRARVHQDRTGVLASWEPEDGPTKELRIAAAGLSVLIWGPGSSVTTPAMATLSRSGTSVLFTGENGAVAYACATPLTSAGAWAMAQARTWADPKKRLTAARALYRQRFPDMPGLATAPLAQLRGMEGARMKVAYQQLAAQYKIARWHRETRSELQEDQVNPLLNLANSILYGVALSACSALALNPALGVIHEGAASALLFDLADLYKAETSLPLAFRFASWPDGAARLRKQMREYLWKKRVLEGMVSVLGDLFGPEVHPASGDVLLDDHDNRVEGMRNYGATHSEPGQV